MSQVAVHLNNYYGGYFDQRHQADIYHTWLTERNATFTFMLEDVYCNVPHIVLLSPEDATAFKLRFGL